MTDPSAPGTSYSIRECTRCGDSMVPIAAPSRRRSWRCPSCGKTAK